MKYVALNIEDAENEHYRKDFNLKFSSVVIVKSKKGETEKYKNLESVIEEDGKRLSIKFGSTDYIVHTHIDGGYAGEISVYLVNIPFLKIA